ncbi:NAD-dependent epimerase/dehydratase family protein [Sulfobacillus harzensis]|uniref:NAD(P)-dependent oxidoreductase n=1 Tax=Sulfobacillus harzensis TaxID=2729629 RepID=A0A7Y0Q377_9FIRM|nr:NAD(P)-dependent oxidoreductase [Sulfobacillus harzensis]NMP23943.1 NAD(P)-dependent oxidoreductase [Sulfobacillus harzensis]
MENLGIKTMNVVLVGANGFIGSWTAYALLKRGHSVTGVCRQLSQNHWRLKWLRTTFPKFQILPVSSITAPELAPKLGSQGSFDVLINCAGDGIDPLRQEPSLLWEANFFVTAQAIETCQALSISRLVLSGTGFEYGFSDTATPVAESSPLKPTSPYSLSKVFCYYSAERECRRVGIQLIYLRVFGVIGPGDNAHRLVPSVIQHLRHAEPVPLTDGCQVRDFLAAQDVGYAFAIVSEPDITTANMETFNISSGQGIAVRDIVEMVRRELDAPSSMLLWGTLPHRRTEGKFLIGDSSKLQQASEWSPSVTLAKAVTDSITFYETDWFRKRNVRT